MGYDSTLEHAQMNFPKVLIDIVDIREIAFELIEIQLADGRIFLYDDFEDTLRRIPNDPNHMSKEETDAMFGVMLRHVMDRKSCTQQMLAEATGIQECQISNYIHGLRSPTFYNLDKIVRALGCSAEDLRYVR
mgnify:FL=1